MDSVENAVVLILILDYTSLVNLPNEMEMSFHCCWEEMIFKIYSIRCQYSHLFNRTLDLKTFVDYGCG